MSILQHVAGVAGSSLFSFTGKMGLPHYVVYCDLRERVDSVLS